MAATETGPRELIHTLFERLNDRDANALLPFYVEDVVEDWPIVGRLEGSTAVRDHFAATFAAMPDFHIDIERMAADGESVFVHWHVTGMFTGAPFNGIVATGRPIDLRGTDCFTVRNGKIVGAFVAYDGMSFRRPGWHPAATGHTHRPRHDRGDQRHHPCAQATAPVNREPTAVRVRRATHPRPEGRVPSRAAN